MSEVKRYMATADELWNGQDFYHTIADCSRSDDIEVVLASDHDAEVETLKAERDTALQTALKEGIRSDTLQAEVARLTEQRDRAVELLRDAGVKLTTEGHGKWFGTVDIDAFLSEIEEG